MKAVTTCLWPLLLFGIGAIHLYGQLSAQFLPLGDLKAGQKGVGRTVFAGTAVASFDVEILGVMENTGPKQSLILGRLSGGRSPPPA